MWWWNCKEFLQIVVGFSLGHVGHYTIIALLESYQYRVTTATSVRISRLFPHWSASSEPVVLFVETE
jgi:hypothetical protein